MSYPHHLEVDSAAAAVALAEGLLAAGEYSIFRGQTTDWPMRASFCRLKPYEREAAEREFIEFAGFVHATPELASLRGDRFGIMAIAQHYRIPTVLVDFSAKPEVAGWFATHGFPPKDGRRSVIYLAHEEYLADIYHERLPALHVQRIAVDNLWRLQTQAGLFLHLPFDDDPELDNWLAEGFGSIRFPFRGPLNQIPDSAIYPNRKSRLEILFDGFTTEQRLRTTHQQLRERGLRISPAPDSPPARAAPAFVGESPPPVHPSWDATRIAAWVSPPVQNFRRQDCPPELTLGANAEQLKSGDPRELQQRLAEAITGFLSNRENVRAGFLNFRLRIADFQLGLDDRPHPDSRLRRTAGQDLADCWDGMRLFPYPDEVLAEALAFLAAAWFQVHGNHRSIYDTLAALLGSNVFVEFGLTVGGQHVTGVLPETECIAAFRGDLLQYLQPEFHDWHAQPDRLLHQVIEPQRLFDFDRFASLFGRRLVPTQFLLRQREVVLFSPAGIQRLGNR